MRPAKTGWGELTSHMCPVSCEQMHPMMWLCVLVLVCSLPVWATARDLIIGQGTDVSHLDPHYSTGSSDVNVYFNLYDNLVLRDEQLNLAPGLATSWQLI